MLYDRNYYNILMSQINNFLIKENNYIHSICYSDLNYIESFGFSFLIRFKTYSGYDVRIDCDRNVFSLSYENCFGENGLGNIIQYNSKVSERNIVKAIVLFKLLDKKNKLWLFKWVGQNEVTIVDAYNCVSIIPSNKFFELKKRKKIKFFEKIFLQFILNLKIRNLCL